MYLCGTWPWLCDFGQPLMFATVIIWPCDHVTIWRCVCVSRSQFSADICCSSLWLRLGAPLGLGSECWTDLEQMLGQCSVFSCYGYIWWSSFWLRQELKESQCAFVCPSVRSQLVLSTQSSSFWLRSLSGSLRCLSGVSQVSLSLFCQTDGALNTSSCYRNLAFDNLTLLVFRFTIRTQK